MKLLLAAVFLSGLIAAKANAQIGGNAWMILKNGCDSSIGYCGYVDPTTQIGDITNLKPQSEWSSDYPKLVTYGASQFN